MNHIGQIHGRQPIIAGLSPATEEENSAEKRNDHTNIKNPPYSYKTLLKPLLIKSDRGCQSLSANFDVGRWGYHPHGDPMLSRSLSYQFLGISKELVL